MFKRLVVLIVVVAAVGVLGLTGGATAPTSPISAPGGTATAQADQHRPSQTSLNIALEGTATADTEATGSPAANAIDGSASTQWCSTQWTGSVTVDLGRARTLDGLGL